MKGFALRAPEARVAAFAVIATAALTALLLSRPETLELSVGRSAAPVILVAAAVGALALRFYAAGLPLLVAFVFLNLSEALVRYHEFPSLLQLLVVGLTFAAWLHRDTERFRDVAAQPITIAIAVYLLIAVVSTLFAADPERADARVIELIKASILYALATALMRNRERARLGVYALLASATFVSVLVTLQSLSGAYGNEFGGLARVKNAQIYADVFQPRIAGPLGDPNFFAQTLLIPLPAAIVFAWMPGSIRRRGLCAACAGLISVALLLTYSRGAMLAVAVMGLLLLGVLHISWKRTAAALVIAAVAFLAIPDSFTRRIVTIEELLPAADAPIDPDSSFRERRLYMQTAWVMFGDNPLTGVGAANYTTRYEQYAAIAGSAARQYEDASALHFPHNLALEVAAETGVFGVIAFTALVVVVLRALGRAWKRFQSAGDGEMELIAVAFIIAAIGYLVSSLFLHLAFPRYLWLLFAFAAALDRLSAQRDDSVEHEHA